MNEWIGNYLEMDQLTCSCLLFPYSWSSGLNLLQWEFVFREAVDLVAGFSAELTDDTK